MYSAQLYALGAASLVCARACVSSRPSSAARTRRSRPVCRLCSLAALSDCMARRAGAAARRDRVSFSLRRLSTCSCRGSLHRSVQPAVALCAMPGCGSARCRARRRPISVELGGRVSVIAFEQPSEHTMRSLSIPRADSYDAPTRRRVRTSPLYATASARSHLSAHCCA